MHSCSFYSDAHCYLISLTDSDGISGTLNLSNSASDGIFWNLITGCTALISDGTFNQKGNQKVIHSWDSLQSQRSHNTTCCKGLLASSPYVAIKSNWLLSSQHPLSFSKIQIAQPSVDSQCGAGCSWEISMSHAETCLTLSIWLSKLSKTHLFRSGKWVCLVLVTICTNSVTLVCCNCYNYWQKHPSDSPFLATLFLTFISSLREKKKNLIVYNQVHHQDHLFFFQSL